MQKQSDTRVIKKILELHSKNNHKQKQAIKKVTDLNEGILSDLLEKNV